MTARSNGVDAAKGFAILLVCIYHIWRYLDRPSFEWLGFDFFAMFRRGDIGVEFFFVISGYLSALSLSKKDAASQTLAVFFPSRLFRLIVPYYTALLFWVIVLHFELIRPCPHSFFDIIAHMTFMHTLCPSTFFSISGVFWFLGSMMQLYLLTPLIYKLAKKSPWLVFALTTAISYFANYYAKTIAGDNFMVLTYSAISYLPLIVMGFILFDKEQAFRKFFSSPFVLPVYLLVVFLLLFRATYRFGYFEFTDVVAGLVLGLSMPLLNHERCNKLISFCPLLPLIGRASFSIFAYNYIYLITGEPVYSGLAGWLYTLTQVLSFGLLMYWLVEKGALPYIIQHWTGAFSAKKQDN